jgi:hypothetical protein
LNLRCLLFRRRCDGGSSQIFKKSGKPRAGASALFHALQLLPDYQTLRVTPAMEAGVTDHVLSLDEVIDLP